MKKRAAGRPKKTEQDKLVDLPFKVEPDTLGKVEEIALLLDRPRGWVARKLLERGVEMFLQDIQTKLPEEAIYGEEIAANILQRFRAAGLRIMSGQERAKEEAEREEAIRTLQIDSPEAIENLAEELTGGEPFIKKIETRDDQPFREGDPPLDTLQPFILDKEED